MIDRVGPRLRLGTPLGIGKPNPLMMRTALNAIDAHSEDSVMIGDNMDTDVIMGLESGLETILVLSGGTSRDDLDRYAYRPELIVEVAFDGVQASPRYAGGLALRFARVKGYREDKTPEEADTAAWLAEIRDRWG